MLVKLTNHWRRLVLTKRAIDGLGHQRTRHHRPYDVCWRSRLALPSRLVSSSTKSHGISFAAAWRGRGTIDFVRNVISSFIRLHRSSALIDILAGVNDWVLAALVPIPCSQQTPERASKGLPVWRARGRKGPFSITNFHYVTQRDIALLIYWAYARSFEMATL